MTALAGDSMAGKKVATLSVKLHMDVIESARVASAIENISMTDMLSDILRPIVAEREQVALSRRSAATAPKATPKRKGKAEE